MRIGINGSSHIALASPVDTLGDHAAEAEADGFDTYWVAQLAWPDALTAIAAIGHKTSRIRFGTAVISTWTRHPFMLAGQALTTSHVTDGRLILGIGLAHKSSIEATYEMPFTRPARHMAEYLDVLLPAMSDRMVDASGDVWSAHVEGFGVPEGVEAPPVMLAAMGPRMLALAGGRTDGTILWLAGPKAVDGQIRPALEAAAAEAGRAMPEIVASVPVCVTDQPDAIRGMVAAVLDGYNDLPSYRGVMDVEGVDGPADVSIIGSAAEVRAGIERFASAGVTEFSALEFTSNAGEAAATRALLKELNGNA